MRRAIAGCLLLGLYGMAVAQADELPRAAAPAAAASGAEHLELDPSAIRGNQELPRVLYVVPWKEPGPAALAGRPLNSLMDEVLAPVDREVFRRQMLYFNGLYAAGDKDGPAAGKRR